MPYRHIVLFRFHDAVTDAEVRSAERALAMLGDGPGVTSFVVRRSDDERKGRVVVQNAQFVDRAAFEAWADAPPHRDAGRQLSRLADWWVADHPE